MRQEKAAALLKLARRLAASAEGMTLDEMAAALGVRRRTAERCRDALLEIFPNIDEVADGATKRFRITGGLDGFFQSPTTDELLALNKAAADFRGRGLAEDAASLGELETKIRAALRDAALRKLAPDLEALLRAEFIAVQAGPRPVEDPGLLIVFRNALLAMKAVRFVYQAGSKPGTARKVVPCGIIFGRMNYLVGHDLGATKIKTWRLDRIKALEILDAAGLPPASFSLADYANGAFAFYHDKPEDVILRILKEGVDDDFVNWRFHPSQTVDRQADGSAIVRFRASGMLELVWHLFTWGNKVQIIAPATLREAMLYELKKAVTQHEAEPSSPGGR